jgi:hypothetical protein
VNLKGWVYDEQGNPIVGAAVEAFDYGSGNLLASTSSGSDGSWVLTGLPDRPVRVRVSSSTRVRYLEGGARIVVEEVTVQNLKVLGSTLLAENSVPGVALQDGSVSTLKLAPLVPLLEGIEVPPDSLIFQKNDRLQIRSGSGIRVRLFPSAKRLEFLLDPILYWSPFAWLFSVPPGGRPAMRSGSSFT